MDRYFKFFFNKETLFYLFSHHHYCDDITKHWFDKIKFAALQPSALTTFIPLPNQTQNLSLELLLSLSKEFNGKLQMCWIKYFKCDIHVGEPSLITILNNILLLTFQYITVIKIKAHTYVELVLKEPGLQVARWCITTSSLPTTENKEWKFYVFLRHILIVKAAAWKLRWNNPKHSKQVKTPSSTWSCWWIDYDMI